ncbi:MAG: TolC family protein, partial [Myxococcota bacterium]
MRPSSRTLPVRRAALATVLIVLALAPASARGESLDLTTVMARAAERPAAQAATERARAARAAVAVERRQAILPAVQVSASYDLRSRALTQTTPIGVFELGARDNRTMSVALVQPVFDASRLLYSVPAARHDARAAELAAERTREDMAAAAA